MGFSDWIGDTWNDWFVDDTNTTGPGYYDEMTWELSPGDIGATGNYLSSGTSIFDLDYSSLFDPSIVSSGIDILGKVGTTALDLGKSAINSPTVMGLLGGLADGYQNQQQMNISEDQFNALMKLKEDEFNLTKEQIDEKQRRYDKHVASLQNPHEDITKQIKRL